MWWPHSTVLNTGFRERVLCATDSPSSSYCGKITSLNFGIRFFAFSDSLASLEWKSANCVVLETVWGGRVRECVCWTGGVVVVVVGGGGGGGFEAILCHCYCVELKLEGCGKITLRCRYLHVVVFMQLCNVTRIFSGVVFVELEGLERQQDHFPTEFNLFALCLSVSLSHWRGRVYLI